MAPDALVAVHQRVGDEDALEILATGLGQGVLGGFGNDDLVGLTVDHELPTSLVDVVPFLVLPDGETPLLEGVDRVVHVPGDGCHQVLTGDAHEVVAHVVAIVLQCVVAAVEVHVLVDGRKAHGHGAGTVHGSLVHQGDLEAMLLGPVRCFHGRAAAGHTASRNQKVGLDYYSLEIRHFLYALLRFFFRRNSVSL